jgi:uncharacterized delta-60 repeat protein
MKKELFLTVSFWLIGGLCYTLFAQAGSLDCTFGENGVLTTVFTADKENVSNDLVYYESGTHSGKLVVVGNADDASGSSDFAVVRYLADGTIDSTFSSDGKLTIDFGYDFDRALGVAIQSDDKIVVVGTSGNPSFCAIARINADGTLDNTFSTDGKERVVDGYWNDVAIDGSGNIWVAGSTDNRSTVLKFSSTGSLLGTYEYDLTAGTTCCESFSALTVDASDKIVVVGGAEQTTRDMSVIRINSSGVLDTGFDTDGIKYIDFGSDWDVAGSVAINSTGQIAVAGEANDGDFGIALLNADGSFVTSFSTDGKVVVDLDGGTSDQSGSGVAFQSDGKIIGGCYAGGQYGIARFNTDGSLDTDFDSDGKAIYKTGVIGGDYPYNFALSPAGKFVGVGIAWVEYGDDGKDFGILAVRTESENMLFGSVTCTQNSDYFSPGTQKDILCIEVDMCGDLNPYSLTQFNLNTNGTTNTADITSATVYYTGTNSSFSATSQFGTVTTSPNGSFTVTGSQQLAHGTNYFWLAYSIPQGATQGNFLDAECTQVTIDGGIGNITPDVTAPAESMEIKTIIFEEDFGENEEAIPVSWTNQDVDGDGIKWTEINDLWGEVNGRYGGGVRSASWDDSTLTPVDNRLVTPEIDLSGYTSATLTYYIAIIDNSNSLPENLETYISTNWNGTDNFPTTTQLESYTISTYVWTKRTVSLDAYLGDSVNICFRHNVSAENWALRLDNILITGTPAGSPEIALSGNNIEIISGDAEPSVSDSTDFGDTITIGGSVTHTFTISNTGNASLNLTGTPAVEISGANASDFTVTAAPNTSIPASSSTTFQVEFDPSGTGIRTANISIANDDSDENPYTFSIQGTGVKDTPEITAWPTTSAINYGDSVGSSTLSGGSAAVEGSFSFADSTIKPSAGSLLTIVDFTPDDTANIKTASNEVSITINKATLSVTAEDKNKTYGEANPTFTLEYTGWIGTDNVDSLDVEPGASSTADETTGAGSVDISVTGGSDNNYIFNSTNGTLTIGKATLSATAEDKSREVSQANPELTIQYSGFKGSDNIDSINVLPTASTEADVESSPGDYEITVAGGEDNNYEFSYISGTLTVSSGVGLSSLVENAIKVYPVLATNKVMIEHNFAKPPYIRILDLGGNLIIGKKLEGNLVDVSSLPSGMYILKINGACFKIIKN